MPFLDVDFFVLCLTSIVGMRSRRSCPVRVSRSLIPVTRISYTDKWIPVAIGTPGSDFAVIALV